MCKRHHRHRQHSEKRAFGHPAGCRAQDKRAPCVIKRGVSTRCIWTRAYQHKQCLFKQQNPFQHGIRIMCPVRLCTRVRPRPAPPSQTKVPGRRTPDYLAAYKIQNGEQLALQKNQTRPNENVANFAKNALLQPTKWLVVRTPEKRIYANFRQQMLTSRHFRFGYRPGRREC